MSLLVTARAPILPTASARLPSRPAARVGGRAALRPATRLGASASEVPPEGRHFGEPACSFLPGGEQQAECWQSIVDNMPPTSKSAAIARDHLLEMDAEEEEDSWLEWLGEPDGPWERVLFSFLGSFGTSRPKRTPSRGL
mmetsp:Transcript_32327/g.102808  ORF Transcript_32327/g.102808 Transcript_32327/m.102808 type:complete len:140 (+) Transcript_32327:530-949(+)